MRNGLFVITGKPGSGKTTIAKMLFEDLMKDGFKVGGFITEEVRKEGKRIGFIVLDLSTGERGILASTELSFGKKIGKYFLNIENIESMICKSIENALKNCDIVIIDEVGPWN